jgi:hypothetical protein
MQDKMAEKEGLVLRILWCSQSGHHLENVLAKFDYKLDIEVGIKNNRTCDQNEGGRQNNQPDDLYGLHRVGSSEILKQTTTPDLFSHSSSQNIPVYIRWSLNRHCL